MCTLAVEHVHGLQQQTFYVRFCNPKVCFCNPNNCFCNPKKKVGLQKGTGYKKERFWVTKKNVTNFFLVEPTELYVESAR